MILTFYLFFFCFCFENKGIQAPRVSIVDGSPLPSARAVTSLIHKDIDRSDPKLGIMLMMFAQFLGKFFYYNLNFLFWATKLSYVLYTAVFRSPR